MDLSDIRREYITKGIARKDLRECPFSQFEQWFVQAQEASLQDPSAFSLATAGVDGQPTLQPVGSR